MTSLVNSAPFLKILYGIEGKYVDVTDQGLMYFSQLAPTLQSEQSKYCSHLIIPQGDWSRAVFFGDHLPGILKHMIVITEEGSKKIQHNETVIVDIMNLDYQSILSEKEKKEKIYEFFTSFDSPTKLIIIHSLLTFQGGIFADEYPEQIMAATFIKPHNKVLEIGANIGRNTLIISFLLIDDKNLVTLECDKNTCKILENNKNINKMNFHIEASALSARKLCQKGWITMPYEGDIVPQDYQEVSTISYSGLMSKYNIEFDTLVADCEGALYYIFQDFPEILSESKIKTIIMENDYYDKNHKNFIDAFLISCNFNRIYVARGGWGPCTENFFETWSR